MVLIPSSHLVSIASDRRLSRVRIVNDITGHTTMVETQFARCVVYSGLIKVIRQVNRQPDQTLRMSLHLLEDIIIVHIHCPLWWGNDLAAASFEVFQPIRQIEQIIWGKGGIS
jgi:hypothetical protein